MCFRNFYRRILSLGLLLSLMLSIGCSTADISPKRISEIINSENDALLLISIGREDRGAGFFDFISQELPFVDYRIYKVEKEKLVLKGTLKSEVVQVGYITGHLRDGKYGAIHLRDLPAGDYLLLGYERGESGSVVPIGSGYMYMPGRPSSPVELAIKIKLTPGKINYVGEILVTDFSLVKNDSIAISNQIERDFEFISRDEGINKQDVIINLAERLILQQK